MSISIGMNIRKLRKERDLSQEVLAERLGISFQAVSRWERGESYPDITMLPTIANFFGITVDDLLGMTEFRESEEVKAIIERLCDYDTHYEGGKMCDTIEEGLKKYPGNFMLMAWYVYAFQRKNPPKAIETGRYVIEHCMDNSIRNRVYSDMVYAYRNNGEIENAIELAKTLPNYYGTSQDILRDCLTGTEQLKHVQHLIMDLAYEFWNSIRKIRHHYKPEEEIELFKKSNCIYDAIYETDDMPIKLSRKMRNYQGMAEVSLQNGWIEEGFRYMEEAVHCAVIHDELPDITYSKSLLYNVHPYDRQYEATKFLKPDLLHDFETEDEFYETVREMEKYKELITMLQK